MNAHTDATTCAICIVITIGIIWTTSIVHREPRMVEVAIRIIRVWLFVMGKVECVGGNEDDTIFGDEHSFIPVVCFCTMREARRCTAKSFVSKQQNRGRLERLTYTGRMRKPSLMIQFMYGRSLKSPQTGILSVPQTLSNSNLAFS